MGLSAPACYPLVSRWGWRAKDSKNSFPSPSVTKLFRTIVCPYVLHLCLCLVFKVCVSSSSSIQVLNRKLAVFVSGNKQSRSWDDMMNHKGIPRTCPKICLSRLDLAVSNNIVWRDFWNVILINFVFSIFRRRVAPRNMIRVTPRILDCGPLARRTVFVSVGAWLPKPAFN